MPYMSEPTVEQCIQSLVATADADYRQQRRYSLFGSAVIATDGGEELSAFVRDVSSTGVGLLHGVPLERDRVTLRLSSMLGRQLDVDADIRWCAAAGDGWYLSGGRFARLSVSQAASLLLAVVKSEAGRRRQHRWPFFRPVTISVGNGEGNTLSAFSRDISPSGIGLLHRARLEKGHVILNVPSATGEPLRLRAKIRWCAPASDGWWTSGGTFESLFLEELPTRRL